MAEAQTSASVGGTRSCEKAVVLHNVSKRFGPALALSEINLEVRSGTIHALVGQNGAGKSTALGILAGRVTPSGGQVEVFGEAVDLSDPRRAHAAGIVAIYQELTIIPQITALENVFLGQLLSRTGFARVSAMKSRFQELCARLDVRINPNVKAGRLSVADQQVLEIMRGVQSDPRILLFDEPTASLAPAERQALFRLMRELRRTGHTMAFVSHNLDEVFDIADDITVFRNGRKVASKRTAEWKKPTLVAAMLGESMTDIYHRREASIAFGAEGLRIENVTVPGALTDVSFSMRQGEILGIGGLAGSGRTTLLRALAGAEPKSRGALWINGEHRPWPTRPIDARELGIAFVPEERKSQGLVLGMTSSENIALPAFGQCSSLGFVSKARLRGTTKSAASHFSFDATRLSEPIRNLSGGNQQKALLARWKYMPPKVLLVDEPTRGIDIGAKAEILDTLRTFSDVGTSVVVVSSELEEIVSLADRVVVLSEGHHAGELDAGRGEVSLARILGKAFSAEDVHV